MAADHEPTPTVLAIGQINFEGNIIPPSWFHHLKIAPARSGTKPLPDLVGIVILSDIIYWYRPVEVRDETTGQVLGYRRKFKGDKLQRSYPQWAELFGLTEKQVMDAVHRLRAEGVVQTELRTVTIGQRRASNVLFVEPVPEKVKEITYRLPSYFKVPASYSEVPASYFEVRTNTETTSETKKDDDDVCLSPEILALLARVESLWVHADREYGKKGTHFTDDYLAKMREITLVELQARAAILNGAPPQEGAAQLLIFCFGKFDTQQALALARSSLQAGLSLEEISWCIHDTLHNESQELTNPQALLYKRLNTGAKTRLAPAPA